MRPSAVSLLSSLLVLAGCSKTASFEERRAAIDPKLARIEQFGLLASVGTEGGARLNPLKLQSRVTPEVGQAFFRPQPAAPGAPAPVFSWNDDSRARGVVLQTTEIAALDGDAESPFELSGSGASCVRTAAAALRRDEIPERASGWDRDALTQCAEFVRTLRYVAIVAPRSIEQGGVVDDTSFRSGRIEGTVTVVDVEQPRLLGRSDFTSTNDSTVESDAAGGGIRTNLWARTRGSIESAVRQAVPTASFVDAAGAH